MQVCNLWNVVTNDTVGVERYVGRRSSFHSPTSNIDWHPLESMLTDGISECCVSIQSSTSSFEEENFDDSLQKLFPVFCAPFLVKHLILYGDIARPYFHRLVSPLINLNELTIHISALSGLIKNKRFPDTDNITQLAISDVAETPENLRDSITPRNLRTLRISMKGFEFWHLQMLRASKMCVGIENLYDILKGSYPYLKRFELGFPFFWDKESDMTKAISEFIHKHHRSLEHLSLEFHFYWRLEDKTFEELSAEDMNAYADIYELPELSEIVNLKQFNIDIIDKRFIVPSIFYWEKLMLQQESLEYLKYKSGYHCILPKCLIERNATSLKSISLTVRANSVLPVDCKVIGHCQCLECLELDGGLRLIHQVIGDTRGPHLIDAESLPKSLKSIRLCSIFIESSDADFICLELSMLKTLHLEDIGQGEGLGLRFSTLCEICNKKQLDSFKVLSALNEASIDVAKRKWKDHSTFESMLLILATFYELPKMVKRHEDQCYIAEIAGVPSASVI